MSERFFDNPANRDALDRHITGNYGEDQFKQFEEEPPPYPDPRAQVREQITQGTTPNAAAGAVAAQHELNDAGYLALLAYAQGFAEGRGEQR